MPLAAHNAYTTLAERLVRFRRRDTACRAAAAAARVGLVVLLAGAGLVVLEAIFYLSPTVKLSALGLGALVALLYLYVHAARPALDPAPLEAVARRVASAHGGLHQQLESAVQLWAERERPGSGVSVDLVDAAVIQAEQVARNVDFDAAIDRSAPVRNLRDLAFAAACIALVFVAFSGPVSNALSRLADPATRYVRPPDTRIVVTPGDARLIAGEPFAITGHVRGVVPLEADLFVREDGSEAWSRILLPVRGDSLAHRIDALRHGFDYRVEAHDAVSPVYTVAVRPRPMIVRITHGYTYPAYTGLPERIDEQGGDIVAPEGTTVRLRAEASLPLSRAWVALSDGERVEAAVSSTEAVAVVTVTGNDRFTVGLVDTGGISGSDPVEYRIVALRDGAPEVRILRPGADGEIGEAMRQPILLEALDDFGVARAELRYRLNDEPGDVVVPVPLDSLGVRSLTQGYLWNLADLDLLPGDVITYRARAYDGNIVTGPAFGESAAFTLRFPSLHEIHEAAMKEQERGLDTMEETLEAGRDLQKRLEEVARDIVREESLSWEGRKEIEAAMKAQEAVQEQVRQTREALAETLDRLEQSGLMTKETLDKIEEVRDLLASIDSPSLQSAMDELRDAMGQADPESIREALEKFNQEHEAFQKGLDRAIALLKRVRDQQLMDALARRMSELAREQQELRENMARENTRSEDIATRQDRLGREAEGLEESLQRAAEELDAPAREPVSDIARDMASANAPERMRDVSRDLRNNARGEAGRRSSALERDLSDLAERMNKARDALAQAQKDEITRELAGLLRNLITLSRAQESTADRAAESRNGQPDENLAHDQARNLSAAGRLAEQLLKAGNKTFLLPPDAGASIGNALRKMADAAGQLQSGSGTRAARSAREAMGGLNAAALAVRQAIGDIASAGSGTGFDEMLQRMQQVSEGQGQVNSETQGLFGQNQRPGGTTPGNAGAMQQLAAQQRALREMLEKIRQELGGKEGEVLGDLGAVSGDMESVTDALGRRELTPETVERQRRILSRLLDAQRSMREQGHSREREARRGADVAYRGPGSLPADMGERANPLRDRLREALREGYGPEYQELIRRYFDRLMDDAVSRPRQETAE